MLNPKNRWPVLVLGALGLAILIWFQHQRMLVLQEETRSLAQESLDKAGFTFARADAFDGRLLISGVSVDEATAKAACSAVLDGVRDRIGLPGIFAEIDCQGVSYPGSAVVRAPLPAKRAISLPTSKKATEKSAQQAEVTCQSRLTEAGKSGSIRFEKGSSPLLGGQEVLDRVAAVAKECSTFKIEIGGHTDTGGAADLNERLSQRRANTVRDFLISKGVPADQVTAKGYGESQPLVNDFPNGNGNIPGQPDSPLREQNRRIEFKITESN
jgi:outer membrane protein OmpA-like peptidoglycan-associated protein